MGSWHADQMVLILTPATGQNDTSKAYAHVPSTAQQLALGDVDPRPMPVGISGPCRCGAAS